MVCKLKFSDVRGHDRIKLQPHICACSEGDEEIVNSIFSIVNCAFVDVPPTMPIKNSRKYQDYARGSGQGGGLTGHPNSFRPSLFRLGFTQSRPNGGFPIA